ncbi:hypothetical protein KC19_VG279500 [Ceratodon purpureus]|uniref:Uncharacterized protein n=1 Tax=Ceratodon purpureus TaxID=3225 RepID=A0A8T0HVB6_CERPU|nr:hypothetical protein KC19_VG279500 [Ceratodon purpureus]KAG0574646.1 hypothetical protein KC19_VG279500 [Ceratodon purpureus]
MSYNLNKDKFEVRKRLANSWETPLSWTFCSAPFYCCFTMLCPCCAAYQQRARALLYNWSRYICCAGMMPCSGSLGERNCPQLCLALEVTCCFSIAVQTTRMLIQDELQLRNSLCDNFIIGAMVCLQYLNCVCDLIACVASFAATESDGTFGWLGEMSVLIDQISQSCYCVVCSCLQTQQHVELNKRDGVLLVRTAPNIQKMTRT